MKRRQCLLLLTAATTAFKATEMPLRAQDIPLFGLRQGLRKAEQEAEQIVKECFGREGSRDGGEGDQGGGERG
ncbi:hypothetical protein PHJA_000860100 [Phtheirospermum japonicum]|uniref:Uncharacterized protein n=1 Tax=Phtheirospermum japonicum TaxID=374723 RepID=A0A830BRT6_9LAMI|nr:hypothetical protein PHJA_000860100 [Phtheirospermum japonicum]